MVAFEEISMKLVKSCRDHKLLISNWHYSKATIIVRIIPFLGNFILFYFVVRRCKSRFGVKYYKEFRHI